MSIVGSGGVGHGRHCRIQKGRGGAEIIFKPIVQSFPAAVYREDNPAARLRRSSRRESSPR
jgi:hypothetical protein